MANAAVVVLTGTESHAEEGRLVNGLQTAAEVAETDDEVQSIVDGAGTQ